MVVTPRRHVDGRPDGHHGISARTAVKGGAAMHSAIEIPDQVRTSFTGDLIRPADPAYEETRRVHNGLIDKRPALIARCQTVPDVVDAVNLGRRQAVEI